MTAAREMEDQDVFVVGGGNSAGQAAVHLSRFARSVTILVRRPSLAETMSQYLVGEIEYNPRIDVEVCTRVVDGGGEGHLEWLCLEDTRTGARTKRDAYGLFLLLGAEPTCTWVPPAVALDDNGFVLTGRDVPREHWTDGIPPADLATTVPGVFAAGDDALGLDEAGRRRQRRGCQRGRAGAPVPGADARLSTPAGRAAKDEVLSARRDPASRTTTRTRPTRGAAGVSTAARR